MTIYHILRPVYKPSQKSPPFFEISFEPIDSIRAWTPEDALAKAKRRGHTTPIVEPAKRGQQ